MDTLTAMVIVHGMVVHILRKILIKYVKYFRWLYTLYYWVGSLVVNVLKILVKPRNNLILFISYGGRKFDDSPRQIYEGMIKDPRFEDYEFIWAFRNPNDFDIPRGKIIQVDSLKYYMIALQARVWISNSSVQRGLSFKGKHTFYVNTWHGTPIKKLGADMAKGNKAFGGKAKSGADIMTAQSKYEVDIISRAFGIPRERFIICGLPRNDRLAAVNHEDKRQAMEIICLPVDKKLILYAPTFREYERDEKLNCVLAPPIDFARWHTALGSEYVVLFRAHYEVAKFMNDSIIDGFVFDVSDYPEINDLIIASDILISDYSSLFFDFSILDRPMFCYTYDYDEYIEKRGVYFDIRKELPGGSVSEDELLRLIITVPGDRVIERVRRFRDKYVECYGHATDALLDLIHQELSK